MISKHFFRNNLRRFSFGISFAKSHSAIVAGQSRKLDISPINIDFRVDAFGFSEFTMSKNGATNCHKLIVISRKVAMKVQENAGFSLVELLLVVAIVGIIAALAVPALQKGIRSAENGTTFATMRTISSTQVSFFSQNNRFGRLTELQQMLSNGLGTTTGDKVIRGAYTFEMNPATPDDTELSKEYTITATRSGADTIYKYELTHTGEIVQILP